MPENEIAPQEQIPVGEKLFQLNSVQIKTVEKITDDFKPEWNSELQADVWNHFADKHNLVFVKFNADTKDERYSVRTKNGIEVSPLELNSKLNSLLNHLNEVNHKEPHIPRAPKSEGFKSFTTISGMPAAKELENWINLKKKTNLKEFMNMYNHESQELYPTIEGFNLDQYQELLTKLACKFAVIHDKMTELSRKENKKIGALNAEKHKKHQLGLNQKSRSAGNSTSSTPRIKKADLSDTQKLMLTMGMDISDPVEVKRFEKEQLSQFAKFKINKTSSTETSFSERKEQ